MYSSLQLKSLLFIQGQKRNRAARKMNLFTTMVELWNYESRNLCSKKVYFSSGSIAVAKKSNIRLNID